MKEFQESLILWLKKNYLPLLIVGAVIGLRLVGLSFGMDMIILALAIIAIVSHKGREFFQDWTIPMILFFVYEALRGFAFQFSQWIGIEIHIEDLIKLERSIFFFLSDIPTVVLQNAMHPNPDKFYFYDYILAFFYVSFFWFWLVVGFILWRKSRVIFKKYIYGLLSLSFFSAIFFFALFPAAPPWWASENGFLEPLERIMWVVLRFNNELSVISTYTRNDFAAMPSLHAAWPFFASLYIVKVYGKKWLPIFIVPIMIAIATWYGAEHYVIDSLLGFFLAFVFYKVSWRWFFRTG